MAKKDKQEEQAPRKHQDNTFSDIMDLIGNEYASIAVNGTSADTAGYYDTGSYALNALYSGDMYKGVPANKIVAIAGEEATGKTFFALAILKHFLDSIPNGLGIIFESEGSVTKKILAERNIDPTRVLVVPVETIQQFKTQSIKIVDNYLKKSLAERRPMLFILDSLGMLSTTKEMNDSESGKEVKDMTRTAEIKAAFRVLTLKLSKAKIPMIVTNHVYQSMGMFPTKEMGGGGGLKYAANSIVALSKSKEKDADGEVTGAVIKCKNLKSRETKEGITVRTLLSFDKGLDRYYGLVDLAIEYGIWEKLSTKVKIDDNTSVFASRITKDPTKFFTKEILEKLNVKIAENFLYGAPVVDSDEVLEDMLNND